MKEQLCRIKAASLQLAVLDHLARKKGLEHIASALQERAEELISANQIDLSEQKGKLSEAMYSRLSLDQQKISTLIRGIEDLLLLPDPLGQVTLHRQVASGLELKRLTTPIGVIAVIFESRPDVAIQIGALLLLSGNAGLLKGGKEAKHTLASIDRVFQEIAQTASLPQNWISLIHTREQVNELIQYDQFIDLVIPRGSNQLVKSIMKASQIPVLGHADGICHLYLADDFDLEEALPIIYDSKMQSPGTCNALETLLLHQSIYADTVKALRVRYPDIKLNEEPSSWSIEWGSPDLSVKSVEGLSDAIHHINTHGSQHTDAILTHTEKDQAEFLSRVDSANVFVNCSTRFSDGFRYGFGAEIGISTSKIHARGPVGIEGLLSYKYQLTGGGHTVKEFMIMGTNDS